MKNIIVALVLILIILEVLYEYPNLQERVKEYMS